MGFRLMGFFRYFDLEIDLRNISRSQLDRCSVAFEILFFYLVGRYLLHYLDNLEAFMEA